MPVPQAGTATTVASTGTYDVSRFGIEGRSVRDAATCCQPPRGFMWVRGALQGRACAVRRPQSVRAYNTTSSLSV